ncbi:RIB43A-like with coiled-coils protein 2 [Anabrus simplex]|uniref:RIB43A-like with coiled-coils protein 2 n=1 Tax=Anabrus simplex TaxID=316456 RepID=UPI0035A37E4F
MLMLPQDLKEAAKIERRRKFEEERRGRIFNARNRLIGIDKEALEKQIKEKQLRDQEERKINEAYEIQRIKEAELASIIERRIEEERRKINEEINRFRATYQKPETRREFDLYDPDALKKAIPCRVHDDDPRCGISSAQKFEGEDLAGKERAKYQIEQNRAWLEQQIAERRAADEERKAAQIAYDEAVLAMDKRACELDRMEQECRRRLKEAHQQFNKVLAEEQAHERRLEAVRELEDNQAEIYNFVTGDFLCENRDVALSNLGSKRVIGYLYKGMTQDELQEVRKVQLKQIAERKRAEEDEAHMNAQWDEVANGMAQHAFLLERELLEKQREINKQILGQNKQLSAQQKSYQEYVEKILYTNKPTAAYFEQFNTSTR